MNDTTGGSAFPHPTAYDHSDHPSDENGMSLRDYFAGQALAVLMDLGSVDGSVDGSYEGTALIAYRQADAMIAEGRKRRAADAE